jgi:hypothetical protein
MGAGEGKGPTTRQEPAIVQQDAQLLPHQGVQRITVALSHGSTPGIRSAPDQIGQCRAQASPDLLDLVIDVAEEGRPVDARGLGLFPDRVSPIVLRPMPNAAAAQRSTSGCHELITR